MGMGEKAGVTMTKIRTKTRPPTRQISSKIDVGELRALTTYFLGVDPGKSGGWAIINSYSEPIDCGLYTEKWIWDWGKPDRAMPTLGSCIALACLESVHAMPGQGVSSMFKFGTNFGWWQGFMQGSKIPFELITPNRWMKEILDSEGGKKTPERRREFVERKWPEVNVKRKKDSGVIDALCLAEFARRRFNAKIEKEN
jgi:hypothetical protein